MSSQGPNYPTDVSDENDNGNPWTNPSNIEIFDANPATVSNGSVSNTLYINNFNFTIPEGATINGVTVTIGRWSDQTGTKASVDYVVRITKSDGQGNNDADTGTHWPGSEGNKSYGGDLWGMTLTPDDVNGSGFGILFGVNGGGSGGSNLNYVDYVNITVDYTYIPPPAMPLVYNGLPIIANGLPLVVA